MSYIIALAGPGCVGKSTTAKKIVEALKTKSTDPYFAINYAFANPIYEIVSYITGWPIDMLKNQNLKEKLWDDTDCPLPCLNGWTPRKLLQIIGTECFRNNVSYDFWIQLAIKKTEKYQYVVMEDARFENEFIASDYVIELSRDGVEYACNHASAMPPNPIYIDKKIHLYPDIQFDEIVEEIIK